MGTGIKIYHTSKNTSFFCTFFFSMLHINKIRHCNKQHSQETWLRDPMEIQAN